MSETISMSAPEVLARTAWGENRGGGEAGMSSVLNVIMNRANNPRWWGNSPRSVCLKPYQFSCWLPGPDNDAMLAVTLNDPTFATAYELAQRALAGALPDATENADSYYAVGTPMPEWARVGTFTVEIANQLFYRTELPPPSLKETP